MKVYSGNMLWKVGSGMVLVSLLVSANEVPSIPGATKFGVCTCCITNQYRAQNGGSALGYSVKLQSASTVQSNYQSNSRQMTHSNSRYGDFMDRITKTSGSSTFMSAAENVAELVDKDAASPKAYQVAADMWYKSPGHRENMLNHDYKVCSACLISLYATQDFSDKMEDMVPLDASVCGICSSAGSSTNPSPSPSDGPGGQGPQTPPREPPTPGNPPSETSPEMGPNWGYGSFVPPPQGPMSIPAIGGVPTPVAQPSDGYPSGPSGVIPNNGGSLPHNCNEYVFALNAERTARGLPQLSYNPKLGSFAQQQATSLGSGQKPDLSNIVVTVSGVLSPTNVGKVVAFYATHVADPNAAIQYLREKQSDYLYSNGVSAMGVGVYGEYVYVVYAQI